MTVEEIYGITGIDPWFLREIDAMRVLRDRTRDLRLGEISQPFMYELKRAGLADSLIARLVRSDGGRVGELDVRARRLALGVKPVYSRVDTCAAEFPAHTPYLYSNYESVCEAEPSDRRKIVVLGGGPNRIGQGIEFDYCCTHASFAFQDMGYETIMVNCNPETVSTDYDTSDRLYFEPLTLEHILNICDLEKPVGVIVQLVARPRSSCSQAGPAGRRSWHLARWHRPGRRTEPLGPLCKRSACRCPTTASPARRKRPLRWPSRSATR
jgi:carbamoyl-phosphate synthase large subunit